MKYFLNWKGFDNPNNPTNKNLQELLHCIGISINSINNTDQIGKIFLTNEVLCLKQNGLQGKLNKAYFENCGYKFLKPLIEIVRPRILIALGALSYRAILKTYNRRRVQSGSHGLEVGKVIQLGGRPLRENTLLFPVFHCGVRVININRKLSDQCSDWNHLGKYVDE